MLMCVVVMRLGMLLYVVFNMLDGLLLIVSSDLSLVFLMWKSYFGVLIWLLFIVYFVKMNLFCVFLYVCMENDLGVYLLIMFFLILVFSNVWILFVGMLIFFDVYGFVLFGYFGWEFRYIGDNVVIVVFNLWFRYCVFLYWFMVLFCVWIFVFRF